ncbi:AfsR/SARP family transcriptional regulator [Nonomuraea roseoviolacea]|uniref:DNA-binding SARP family transcriptional activator n=1 Tax=Nonomuraea roseoviolacea subsp. carminata TaxID=160689 RepID=A0ABT1KFR4_9ACTN|nr:AfsR/SARP family transcriptional regulator [Nonomuraea roseoviolacea]MCP2352858.1 DNA-binding SARP family transcriptional activator [Nonomuraea roseoviolacea subsp. carminata]
MRIGLLGTVRASRGRHEIPLGTPRQRAVLALLALDAGRTVSMERLIAALWGEQPPAGARGLVQGYVSRLRQVLARAGVTIVHGPQGYLLGLAAEQVDLHEFRLLVARARATETDEAQAAGMRSALALWRGEPLTGITGGELLDRLRDTLSEERLAVTEECLNAETRAGRDAVLIPELIALVATHPLREGLVGLLMVALCRVGRRADALDRYEHTRRHLSEELGLDPGPELRQLRQRILRGDARMARAPRLSAAAPAAVPAQLPPEAGPFTGRHQELSVLDEIAVRGEAAAVAMVTGAGGVGKTALAVHWGHRVRSLFPDGQLYVNLHGCSPERPLPPIEALGRLLRALGVPPERVPDTVEEASAAYRSLLADRRVLVVLDDAGGVDQVRPLLPGGRRCVTVVTSRDRLTGLVARDGAVPVPLGMLMPEEAVALFDAILGSRRLAAEPAAARELARLCGYLPLALRIAAAAIVAAPGRDIAGQARRLTRARLPILALHDDPHAAVRGAFDLSYRRLDPPSRRLFRLLGLLPWPAFTRSEAAALIGAGAEAADRLLSRLSAAHLIEECGPGRYTFHDLIREYARERAAAEDSPAARDHALAALHAMLGEEPPAPRPGDGRLTVVAGIAPDTPVRPPALTDGALSLAEAPPAARVDGALSLAEASPAARVDGALSLAEASPAVRAAGHHAGGSVDPLARWVAIRRAGVRMVF